MAEQKSSGSKKTLLEKIVGRDAITILKADHKKVRVLLKKLAEDPPKSTKGRTELLDAIEQEVMAHAAVEEEIFYPAFKRAAENSEDRKMFFEAAEEHDLVHSILPKLRGPNIKSDVFEARAKVLKEVIEHHAKEEEKDMLSRARKIMSSEHLESLGKKIDKRKEQIIGSVERQQDQGTKARVPRDRSGDSSKNSPARGRKSSS